MESLKYKEYITVVDGEEVTVRVYSNGRFRLEEEGLNFTSFSSVQEVLTLPELKYYADALNVKYPRNIGKDTLTKKVDKKIQEIVDELNQ